MKRAARLFHPPRRLLAACAAVLALASPAAAGKAPQEPATALGDIQLTQIRLDDAARLLSQVGKANVVVTGQVSEKIVSLYLRDATVADMVKNLCRAAGVWYRYDAGSKTYVIMSGEEYRKDLALVRDEKTRVFTLRHHNVVAAANAIRALFGTRVALAAPVEEMPPTSLGAGSRTRTAGSGTSAGGAGRSGGTGTSGSGRQGGGNAFGGGASLDLPGTGASATGGRGGATTEHDPAKDLDRLSLDRVEAQAGVDAEGRPRLGVAEVQEMAARQGPPIHLTYNRLNNLLLVRTGDDGALEQIAALVRDMDRPPRQVLLEMRILEVTLDDGYRSVFDIGLGGRRTTPGPLPSGALGTTTPSYAKNSMTSGLFDAEQNANLVWQVMSESLSLRLQLLATENKLKTLASPMLVAANNQPARLFIGDERVLTVGASSQSITGTTGATNTQITVETEKRDVGQTLSILPRINGDRSVSLTIDQDSSTVRIGDATMPIATADGNIFYFPIDTVNTAAVQVTAHARDGMTVAIGGMIRESTERGEEKVPLLGDIPGLGFFFKRDVRAAVRSQIVLLITPRVLESPEEADALAQTHVHSHDDLAARVPRGPVVPKPTGFLAAPEAPAGGVDATPSAPMADSAPPTPAAGGSAAAPASVPLAEAAGGQAAFADLARAAARAVRAADPTAPPDDRLRTVGVAGASFRLGDGLEARPVASWRRDGLYVTALRVVNLADRPAPLPAAAFRGRWAALVVERPRLAAATGADSWSWVYAISRLPFDEALERTR
ncbi:MAG: hypothetical protein H3C26_03740 [Rhodocyclaceae bacterium]|nr:hypothetical protein [Rhodocyclaceae bacterium]